MYILVLFVHFKDYKMYPESNILKVEKYCWLGVQLYALEISFCTFFRHFLYLYVWECHYMFIHSHGIKSHNLIWNFLHNHGHNLLKKMLWIVFPYV